jgi:protein phosphatase
MKRDNNEDNFLVLPEQSLFAVFDGMGGHAAGEVASGIAVHEMKEFFELTGKDPEATWPFKDDRARSYDENRLVTSIKLCNARILEVSENDASKKNMGTTCVSLHFVEKAGTAKALVAHAGDSRVYLFRDNKLKRITIDHSLVEEYVRMGKITEEEAKSFPQKNIILRALGQQRQVDVELNVHEPKPGDVFMLCSDGVDPAEAVGQPRGHLQEAARHRQRQRRRRQLHRHPRPLRRGVASSSSAATTRSRASGRDWRSSRAKGSSCSSPRSRRPTRSGPSRCRATCARSSTWGSSPRSTATCGSAAADRCDTVRRPVTFVLHAMKCYSITVSMLARSQILLRYRFATLEQASHHYRVRSAWGIVFFPAVDPRARVGSTAMLEVLFDDSEQTHMIGGEIAAIADGGMWLRSSDLALGKRLEGLLTRRRHRRLGANLFLELRRGKQRSLVTMRDLSLGGAALGNVHGLAVGDTLQARLLSPVTGVPADLGEITVMSSEAGRAGVRFDRADPQARLAVGRFYAALDEAWSRAHTAQHNPLCCRETCLDPSPDGIKLLAG